MNRTMITAQMKKETMARIVPMLLLSSEFIDGIREIEMLIDRWIDIWKARWIDRWIHNTYIDRLDIRTDR